ncbi:MAG: hypothetical protein NW216_14995 [Hyphomicrobium sp.]|nr:hypothetical protein [Hyphomicrobium sp.]
MPINIFLSVGRPFRADQEAFLDDVRGFLEGKGFRPRTAGWTDHTHGPPLKLVGSLMDKSAGALIIALERTEIIEGRVKPGGAEQADIRNRSIPTPWNHIEAAFAYARGLPLLVIRHDKVVEDGMLEGRYDWYVHKTGTIGKEFFETRDFKGSFAAWEQAVRKRAGWIGCRSN